MGALFLASPTSAHQLTPYTWSSAFNGSDSTVGQFSTKIGPLSIDQSSGRVYVVDKALGADKASVDDWVSQFSAAGVAVPFPALGGASSIDTGRTSNVSGGLMPYDVAVDNSAAHRGFYVLNSGNTLADHGGPLRSYGFDGLERPNFPADTPGGTALAVDPQGRPWVNDYTFDPDTGTYIGNGLFGGFDNIVSLAFDSAGNAYVAHFGGGGSSDGVSKYDLQGKFLFKVNGTFTGAVAVDPSDDHVFALTGGEVTEYSPQGVPLQTFADKAGGGFVGFQGTPQGLAINAGTHKVYISNTNFSTPRVEIFSPGATVTVPDATTGAGEPAPTSATVHGVINADNAGANPALDTTDCHFEWGTTNAYGKPNVPCAEGNGFGGVADHDVSATLPGLTLGTTYHYRIAAKNSNGYFSYGLDRTFQAQGSPSSGDEFVSDVNTDGARLHATLDPNGGDTGYHFQYTTEADFDASGFANATSFPASDASLSSNLGAQQVIQTISDLQPDTTYVYRAVPTNAKDTILGAPHNFKTFPLPPTSDPCSNAHVRQQTAAAFLLDCRAYELVSAPNTGGYDAASDLAAGQAPLPAYPTAAGRLLYTLRSGAIPGVSGSPTNYGADPYLAARGQDGWSTAYVGLPADGMAETGAFGSPLLGADPALGEFAFAGSGICAPCFSDGSTNIPLRQADGTIIKGMAGTLKSVANPAGVVRKSFSADGTHFIFATTARFESAAQAGDVTVYGRDLKAGITQIASTLPSGSPMTGVDNAELDVSKDGSRIVIGQLSSTDPAGNPLYHPYMHLGANTHSLDLAPLSTAGVLFDGMSSDGTKVFFTSTEQLIPAQDTDQSADIYEADVSAGGTLSLHLVSIDHAGDPSNDDSCRPPGTLQGPAWNSAYAASEGADCSALAFAGAAGAASGDGSFYFLSPERLDTSNPQNLPVSDQPNLYVKRPGQGVDFVTTIDSSLIKAPKPPTTHPLKNVSLIIGQSGATGDAVDQNGSIYVLNNGAGRVRKLSSTGAIQNYTAGANAGTNSLSGGDAPTGAFSFTAGLPTQIAIDRANNYLYVPDYGHNVVDKFSTAGAYLSQVSVTQPSGVAVNRSNGNLYVASAAGGIKVFDSTGAPLPDVAVNAGSIAVDSSGRIYGVSAGKVTAYAADGSNPVELVASGATDVAVDASGVYPYDGQLYVDEGNQVAVFDAGAQIATISDASFSGSVGVAVGPNHHVYATRAGTRVAEFGFNDPPYAEIDSSAVLDAVSQATIHRYSDFQVSTDGRYAAFSTRLALSDYDNGDHSEVYRFDAQTGALDCASCTPSGAITTTDTFLAPYGLNLTDDGRIFFTSAEPLVLRDTNAKKDAYEWSSGRIELISTGTSSSDSGLFTAAAAGTDVFFFTRQTLSFQDLNGARMKVYDARAGGGFEFVPPRQPCAASDECHGKPSSEPALPSIRTETGKGKDGTTPITGRPRCKAPRVKRHGRCVSRHPKHRRHRKHHRGGSK